jgi:hypothetical protein
LEHHHRIADIQRDVVFVLEFKGAYPASLVFNFLAALLRDRCNLGAININMFQLLSCEITHALYLDVQMNARNILGNAPLPLSWIGKVPDWLMTCAAN